MCLECFENEPRIMEKIAQNRYFYNFWGKVGPRRQNKRKCGAGMHGGLPHIPGFENA